MHQKYKGVLHVFQISKLVLDFLITYSRWMVLIVSCSCSFIVSFLSSSTTLSASSIIIIIFVIIITIIIITIIIIIKIVLCLILHPVYYIILSSVYLYGYSSYCYKFSHCFHHEILILTTSTSWLSLYCHNLRKPSETNNTRQISPMN